MRAQMCAAAIVALLNPVVQGQVLSREEQLAPLRERALARLAQDRSRYSEQQLADIEARYRASRIDGAGMMRPDAGPALSGLVAAYPASNRAGCAAMELVQLTQGPAREAALKAVIAHHSDAWFENGTQVGALARAQLAVYYADIDRFAEAERLAADIIRLFPGSVDRSGAPLEAVAEGIKLLRPPK